MYIILFFLWSYEWYYVWKARELQDSLSYEIMNDTTFEKKECVAKFLINIIFVKVI